jgi:hypothetical protein
VTDGAAALTTLFMQFTDDVAAIHQLQASFSAEWKGRMRCKVVTAASLKMTDCLLECCVV